MPPRLVLASASPGRLAVLRAAGVAPEVVVSGVDESGVDTADPAEHALVLAGRKADAVAAQLASGADRAREPTVVLGCDSVLAVDGEVHGKPETPRVAAAWWHRMRGGRAVLHTGHCLVRLGDGRRAAGTASTVVRFGEVSDAEIEAYVATGEPRAVAGGFTIDGYGAAFVDGVDGDYHNVIGVCLPLLRRLLADLGVSWPSLWRPPGAG